MRSVDAAQLAALHLSAANARKHALANLDALMRSAAVHMQVFSNGPGGKPFILVGGHWAAASAIVLPQLRTIAAGALHASEIVASIPRRDAMLIFAKGDRTYRDEMRALVLEKESGGEKPLTLELFELTVNGPVPLAE